MPGTPDSSGPLKPQTTPENPIGDTKAVENRAQQLDAIIAKPAPEGARLEVEAQPVAVEPQITTAPVKTTEVTEDTNAKTRDNRIPADIIGAELATDTTDVISANRMSDELANLIERQEQQGQ